MWQNSDNYRQDKENSAFGVNPVLSWRLSNTANLHVDLEYFRSDYASDSGLPIVGSEIADVPRRRSYQFAVRPLKPRHLQGPVEYINRITGHLTLRNKLYYTDLDWPSEGLCSTALFRTPAVPWTCSARF